MSTQNNIEFLQTLETVIESRKNSGVDDSYTAQLFASGPARIAQKIGEEGVELALASVIGTREEIVCEASDMIYHLLVLLNTHEISFADIVTELEARHHRSHGANDRP